MSSNKTQIEWTDATWNPVRGCSRVSEGCKHCYAETQAARIISMDRGRGVPDGEGSYDGLLAKGGQWNGKIRLVSEALSIPLRWSKSRMIFVNSMSDLFHENVPDYFIDQVFAVMALAHQHTFQILTKRPERMLEYCKNFSFDRVADSCRGDDGVCQIPRFTMQDLNFSFGLYGNAPSFLVRNTFPLPNVWLGVSVEDQKTANERIPLLLQTPASIRWISAEPLLGAIDLRDITFPNENGGFENWDALNAHGTESGCKTTLDWVVVGGESGDKARPMHPDWVRSLRNHCAASNVPFLFKQWGEFAPVTSISSDKSPLAETFFSNAQMHVCERGERIYRIGKKRAGRLLDGVLNDGYPEVEFKRVVV